MSSNICTYKSFYTRYKCLFRIKDFQSIIINSCIYFFNVLVLVHLV